MNGIIFLTLSIVLFGGLFLYIKKIGSIDRKEIENEILNPDLESNTNEDLNMDDDENSKFTYESYKEDKEFLQAIKFVKAYYIVLVTIVIALLGVLYIYLRGY